jgi:GrpB-like predicted nucleotidyltransferase (UPF0157 family)
MQQDDDPSLIRDYNPSWPALFAKLAKRVETALGDIVLRMEHVGSTAVPGLAAKPIVDMDVVVRDANLQEAIEYLADLGYEHEGNLGIPGREAFLWPQGETRHHLYLLAESAAEWRRHLAFRDALRANPELRDRYAALKRSLAARYHCDLGAYTLGKSAFIEAALRTKKRRPHPWRLHH